MDFPRILYHATEPTGRIFQTQAELEAAGPGWVMTPTEAAEAAQTPAAHTDGESSESPPPRSRR